MAGATPRRLRALALPPVDKPAEPTLAEVAAIKALSTGKASEHQQGIAWNFILRRAAGIQEQSFRSNDALGMAFKDGRRFVGIQLLTISQIDTSTMKKDDT